MPIRILEAAREELVAAAQYYRDEDDTGELARDFVRRFRQRLDFIERFPLAGARVRDVTGPELRRFRLTRFPYYVFAVCDSEPILVVAVAHERREPGYWKGRLGAAT